MTWHDLGWAGVWLLVGFVGLLVVAVGLALIRDDRRFGTQVIVQRLEHDGRGTVRAVLVAQVDAHSTSGGEPTRLRFVPTVPGEHEVVVSLQQRKEDRVV